MTTQTIKPKPTFDERFLMRQRWARVGWVYGIMLLLGVLFIGPFYVAFLGSLKDNPLEWPFRYSFAQVLPQNWAAAWRLGREGAGNPWLGGFAPGAKVSFDLTFFVPPDRAVPTLRLQVQREGQSNLELGNDPRYLDVVIPRRKAGAGLGAVFSEVYAADHGGFVGPGEMLSRAPGRFQGDPGLIVQYRFNIAYQGLGPTAPRLPLDVLAPAGVKFVGATLDPNRMERLGRVASWDGITPGWVGYVFRNYVRVFNEARDPNSGSSFFLRWTANNFFVCIMAVVINLLLASLAGYALARMYLPGKNLIFAAIIFLMAVPQQATFISNYLVLRDLHLLGNLWGMVVWIGVDMAKVFLMKQFFENIPREIEEAALIDGANPITTFFRVILPMATPALGAVTILTFQGVWNEFFKAAVVLSGQQANYTLPLGLSFFRSAYGVAGDWGLMLASAFLSMVPIVILFIIFQRYFVEGVSTSGVKG